MVISVREITWLHMSWCHRFPSSFYNSSGLKSVVENFRFRDGLARTVGLTMELNWRFSNRPFAARSAHMVQVAKWDFQNKGRSRWTGTSSIVQEVPLCSPACVKFVPCDRDRTEGLPLRSSGGHGQSRIWLSINLNLVKIEMVVPLSFHHRSLKRLREHTWQMHVGLARRTRAWCSLKSS